VNRSSTGEELVSTVVLLLAAAKQGDGAETVADAARTRRSQAARRRQRVGDIRPARAGDSGEVVLMSRCLVGRSVEDRKCFVPRSDWQTGLEVRECRRNAVVRVDSQARQVR